MGGQGAGARETRGREGYGRRKRKGREVGVLRGREAGEKCETLIFFNTFKNKKPKYISLACIVSSVTFETSEQTSKWKFVAWAEKQAYFRSNSKPVYSGYVIRHEMLSRMSAHVLRELSDCKNWDEQAISSSKIILLGLSILRCGSERSVHGRPSWELAPYDHESERPNDFTVCCRGL